MNRRSFLGSICAAVGALCWPFKPPVFKTDSGTMTFQEIRERKLAQFQQTQINALEKKIWHGAP